MKQAELLAFVQSGKIVAVAEWRSATAETRTGTGKSGAWSIASVTHRVEVGPDQLEVTEELAKGTDTNAWKTPFTKGQPVVIEFHLRGPEKGQYRVAAKLHPLEK